VRRSGGEAEESEPGCSHKRTVPSVNNLLICRNLMLKPNSRIQTAIGGGKAPRWGGGGESKLAGQLGACLITGLAAT